MCSLQCHLKASFLYSCKKQMDKGHFTTVLMLGVCQVNQMIVPLSNILELLFHQNHLVTALKLPEIPLCFLSIQVLSPHFKAQKHQKNKPTKQNPNITTTIKTKPNKQIKTPKQQNNPMYPKNVASSQKCQQKVSSICRPPQTKCKK